MKSVQLSRSAAVLSAPPASCCHAPGGSQATTLAMSAPEWLASCTPQALFLAKHVHSAADWSLSPTSLNQINSPPGAHHRPASVRPDVCLGPPACNHVPFIHIPPVSACCFILYRKAQLSLHTFAFQSSDVPLVTSNSSHSFLDSIAFYGIDFC